MTVLARALNSMMAIFIPVPFSALRNAITPASTSLSKPAMEPDSSSTNTISILGQTAVTSGLVVTVGSAQSPVVPEQAVQKLKVCANEVWAEKKTTIEATMNVTPYDRQSSLENPSRKA